jgi:uncharacterized damage-inducible protein DinB
MPGSVRPVADERDALLAFLDQQRRLLRVQAHGLTDEQARTASTAGALTIGGLVKHLAGVERWWIAVALQRPRPPVATARDAYMDAFTLRADETLAGVLADYERAAVETEEAIASVADLGQPVPVPRDAPWLPQDIEAWSVRWVLLHLIEETARHLGHADIIRESLDGATAIPLLAAVEGWPETPWVKPWRPAAATA